MMAERLDPARIEHALKRVIKGIDYDLHKDLEYTEEGETPQYEYLAEQFGEAYASMPTQGQEPLPGL